MKRALLTVLALAACKEPRTELILGIATDLRATDNLDSVHLQLLVDDVPFHEETWSITGSPSAPFNLPGSFGVYRDGDHDRVQIKLVGTKNGTTLVTREATLGFIDGKTSFYRMGLTSTCMTMTCPTGQTCVEGVCKGRELDASMFPSFEGALVTELTCKQPGTPNYLDTATGQAMPLSSDAAACPGNLCAEGTCLVPPAGDARIPIGDPCMEGGPLCVPGGVCWNDRCVGEGSLRFSLAWSAVSDFDLHLLTPTGKEINFSNSMADGGVLDVDDCVSGCAPGTTHVENIVFSDAAPRGTYQVWVENFDGGAAGSFTIEVFGASAGPFSANLPMQSGAMSQRFNVTY